MILFINSPDTHLLHPTPLHDIVGTPNWASADSPTFKSIQAKKSRESFEIIIPHSLRNTILNPSCFNSIAAHTQSMKTWPMSRSLLPRTRRTLQQCPRQATLPQPTARNQSTQTRQRQVWKKYEPIASAIRESMKGRNRPDGPNPSMFPSCPEFPRFIA